MVSDGVLKVGDKAGTPDGDGKVTKVTERFISVDLANGSKGQYTVKDLSVKVKE